MFSALKKLTRNADDRCPAPVPMSSSLQKKFSKGVHFNMKILIKGDRNVGKSCLLQRLQGGPFAEDYVPTDQIQVAPIHWAYKNTDHIVKVEVWEVVDKGRTKKKAPLGLKLENSTSAMQDNVVETPVLDASFLDVYKNASGVIMMFDITKPWTFDYVVKELSQVPADLPVVVLGNHCDMQHHRQVHPHYIEQTIHQAKLSRTAPIRYAESSMRNGFGLRLLHKFLNVPFLRLQKTSLLEQLQRNRKDMEDTENELDDFQKSDESHYNTFVDRLASKRRASGPEPRVNSDRAPSIVLGGGKPIIPSNVNPLLAQSLNPLGIKAQHASPAQQNQYVSPELMKKYSVSMDVTPSRPAVPDSAQNTVQSTNTVGTAGDIEDFYAGALDTSFLDDLAPMPTAPQDAKYDSDSDEGNKNNPRVTVAEDDLDIDFSPPVEQTSRKDSNESKKSQEHELVQRFSSQAGIINDIENDHNFEVDRRGSIVSDADFPLWARDSSARRSPEGGEDPQIDKEPEEKAEKKHKKKKSKDKEKSESEKSERKDKKHKRKKSKTEKSAPNPQQDLLMPTTVSGQFDYDEYDSI